MPLAKNGRLKLNRFLLLGLTWRDVQHIVIRTANPEGILKTDDWSTNSAGRKVT